VGDHRPRKQRCPARAPPARRRRPGGRDPARRDPAELGDVADRPQHGADPSTAARHPEQLGQPVLQVVELLDGPVGRDAEGVLGEAAAAARAVMERTTIADVVEREVREAGVAMYHI
jgi:hypothetical protein